MALMPDYRSEKMDSPEGGGRALGHWRRFIDRVDPDALDVAAEGRDLATPFEELPEDVQEEMAIEAIERSELVGFWVAWHLAGGFSRLEGGGWNRSTIFRKIRRFRAVFGDHPDSYRFDWLKLDPAKVWNEEITRHIDRAQAAHGVC
jgi:hypothetical protein